MEDYLTQIDCARAAGLYYVALGAALTIPDMCAAAEAEDGLTNAARYKAWFDVWPGRHFFGMFTGADCYDFRCAFLHQGQTGRPSGRYQRVLFVEPLASTNLWHCNVMGDALNIDVGVFCAEMTRSAREWLQFHEETELVQANLGRFVRRYAEGAPPFITDVPVIF